MHLMEISWWKTLLAPGFVRTGYLPNFFIKAISKLSKSKFKSAEKQLTFSKQDRKGDVNF